MTLKDHLNSIFDVFSRRQSPRREAYKSDELSERLRNRILLLIRDLVAGKWRAGNGSYLEDHTYEFWQALHQMLQHLYGRPHLSGASRALEPVEDTLQFVLSCSPAEFFDFLELTFRTSAMWRILHDSNELVDAINEIFRIENAPYQLTRKVTVTEQDPAARFGHGGTVTRTLADPRVIRADDQPAHVHAIEPALSVLAVPHFEAANLEFREALDEYRKGQYGDCLVKCCSSFESVMKTLCKRNGWVVEENRATPDKLLKTIIPKSKLDSYFEEPLQLIAKMRNRLSTAHGGGTSVRIVERHVAQFALTSTAAAILLLVHEVEG